MGRGPQIMKDIVILASEITWQQNQSDRVRWMLTDHHLCLSLLVLNVNIINTNLGSVTQKHAQLLKSYRAAPSHWWLAVSTSFPGYEVGILRPPFSKFVTCSSILCSSTWKSVDVLSDSWYDDKKCQLIAFKGWEYSAKYWVMASLVRRVTHIISCSNVLKAHLHLTLVDVATAIQASFRRNVGGKLSRGFGISF